MASRTPLLTLRALRVPGLAPVDLDLRHGECVGLRGRSGSGKTLLLRAIADLDPAEGQVALQGIGRASMSGPVWRERVAYVASDSGWWADRVGDHFVDWSAVTDEVAALGLPDDCRDWRVERLSSGERQRLGLLRALERAPSVLLLDEPTSALDTGAARAVEDILARRRAGGAGILWVTHDTAQAERVASRQLRLGAGRLERAD